MCFWHILSNFTGEPLFFFSYHKTPRIQVCSTEIPSIFPKSRQNKSIFAFKESKYFSPCYVDSHWIFAIRKQKNGEKKTAFHRVIYRSWLKVALIYIHIFFSFASASYIIAYRLETYKSYLLHGAAQCATAYLHSKSVQKINGNENRCEWFTFCS